MLTLAVASQSETFERIREPLAARDIRVRHLRARERAVPLASTSAPWSSGDFDVGFVYPSRLMEGGVVDAVLSPGANQFPWVNDREAVLTSRNKAGVLAALSGAGLAVPQSVLVSNPVDEDVLQKVFHRFDPPVVVKPNSTTRGVGVAKVDDLDSFLGVADYLGLVHDYRATGDKSFLVQEFVPNARDFRVMVLDGECVGAVERQLPAEARASGQWKHNVHRGANASKTAVSDSIRNLAESTARVLDIPLLGVDFLVADGRTVITETNARPTIDEESKYEDGFYDRLAALIRSRAADE